MKIGLISVDGHSYPNLALMKISAFHKTQGDSVEWANHLEHYDVVYKSKVFTFTPDDTTHIDAGEIICGGTGYDPKKALRYDVDRMFPDYSLYPYQLHEMYGFLTRGCIRKCPWCIVPIKEGNIRPYNDIEEIARGFSRVVLMDNNVLASMHGLRQIEKIIKLKIKVDFNQGLDARIIAQSPDIAQLLARVKWLKPLRLAMDSEAMMEPVRKAVDLLRRYGASPSRFFTYVLATELEDTYRRVNFCKSISVDPFVQPFRDFTPHQVIPQWQVDMARYTNRRAILKSTDFKDYRPRIGFKCSQYFNSDNL